MARKVEIGMCVPFKILLSIVFHVLWNLDTRTSAIHPTELQWRLTTMEFLLLVLSLWGTTCPHSLCLPLVIPTPPRENRSFQPLLLHKWSNLIPIWLVSMHVSTPLRVCKVTRVLEVRIVAYPKKHAHTSQLVQVSALITYFKLPKLASPESTSRRWNEVETSWSFRVDIKNSLGLHYPWASMYPLK